LEASATDISEDTGKKTENSSGEEEKNCTQQRGYESDKAPRKTFTAVYIIKVFREMQKNILSLLSKYLYFYYGLKLFKKDFIKILSKNKISHIENVL
jgi:hypothetical protein